MIWVFSQLLVLSIIYIINTNTRAQTLVLTAVVYVVRHDNTVQGFLSRSRNMFEWRCRSQPYHGHTTVLGR